LSYATGWVKLLFSIDSEFHMSIALTVFQGRAGDHNDLAIPGALAIGTHLEAMFGVSPAIVGRPAPALSEGWRSELALALPALRELQQHMHAIFAEGRRPLSATSRCAVSLATLPVVARYHPRACIVWFDAHADLNTPASTASGYLGGLALSGPAGMWDSGLGSGVALDDIVLVGQRDLDPFEVQLIESGQVRHVPPGPGLAARLRQAVAGRAVYMHLDCDVLDPGIVPTDYVHPGGLTLACLRSACEVLAEGELLGLEIAEFQNAWAAGGPPVSPHPLLDSLSPVLAKLKQTHV
jgi:hypothetical protein